MKNLFRRESDKGDNKIELQLKFNNKAHMRAVNNLRGNYEKGDETESLIEFKESGKTSYKSRK